MGHTIIYNMHLFYTTNQINMDQHQCNTYNMWFSNQNTLHVHQQNTRHEGATLNRREFQPANQSSGNYFEEQSILSRQNRTSQRLRFNQQTELVHQGMSIPQNQQFLQTYPIQRGRQSRTSQRSRSSRDDWPPVVPDPIPNRYDGDQVSIAQTRELNHF